VVLVAAGCGTAHHQGTTQKQLHPAATATSVPVSPDPPADNPQVGYEFKPFPATSNSTTTMVSVDVAVQAAKDSTIDPDSWTHDPGPTAALVLFTDTERGTRQADGTLKRAYDNIPAWVITGSGAKLNPIGPPGTTHDAVPDGNVYWIIDAITGKYLEAADYAPQ